MPFCSAASQSWLKIATVMRKWRKKKVPSIYGISRKDQSLGRANSETGKEARNGQKRTGRRKSRVSR